VHQDLHPIGPAVGKEVSAVRLRHTEYRDHSGQCVSVPARMSMGSVASQIASTRIIGQGHE
jgi:hypothetical protein